MPVATLSAKGQITIPDEVRKQLRLKAGDEIDFQVLENGTVTMVPLSGRTEEVFGWLARYRKRRPVSVDEMSRLLRRGFKRGRV